MKITWKIVKKRGNWRPILEYRFEITEEEIDLNVPQIVCQTRIPVPPQSEHIACFPDMYERQENWEPDEYYSIVAKMDRMSDVIEITLPWRPGAHPEYPEVKEAMTDVQQLYDKEFMAAMASEAFEESGELDHTNTVKQGIAPMVAAKRMLNKSAGREGTGRESPGVDAAYDRIKMREGMGKYAADQATKDRKKAIEGIRRGGVSRKTVYDALRDISPDYPCPICGQRYATEERCKKHVLSHNTNQ